MSIMKRQTSPFWRRVVFFPVRCTLVFCLINIGYRWTILILRSTYMMIERVDSTEPQTVTLVEDMVHQQSLQKGTLISAFLPKGTKMEPSVSGTTAMERCYVVPFFVLSTYFLPIAPLRQQEASWNWVGHSYDFHDDGFSCLLRQERTYLFGYLDGLRLM